ncbi:5'-nucleotidase domain-containing protein 1 isoform X2 [Syngnathoides biaculeatus]|uniref:5'-nucleotidase domain-containing protein 1 isoform X2 n=1 Tax=Syngnathoides biaculeatus TaxID=300417 RepID=UPI002ADD9B44|nr:5'-nucleotidase domain-containing protein 1 isoform X2 [Syngnathoides biaculeatus]
MDSHPAAIWLTKLYSSGTPRGMPIASMYVVSPSFQEVLRLQEKNEWRSKDGCSQLYILCCGWKHSHRVHCGGIAAGMTCSSGLGPMQPPDAKLRPSPGKGLKCRGPGLCLDVDSAPGNLRATHGTTDLSTEEIIKHYGPKREWKHFNSLNTSFARSAKYYLYDNYFDLPGALLCGRIVDMLHEWGNEVNSDFWKDMVAAIDHNYNTSAFREDAGTYFPNVKRDPGRYLQTCSESVKSWLWSMKNAGKVLLLITSSHSDYCRLICEYILGKDFEELFDVVITNALKPGFFSLKPQQRSFKNLVNDVESEDLPSLDKPGWYSQGNWMHLHELLKTMTGKPEPKVVYFGDSMRSDMFPASTFGKWETVMIVEEMEGDCVPKSDAAKSKEGQVEPQEKKGKFEESMKSPSTLSNQWGSYFVDVHRSGGKDEDSQKLTWCCHCIHKYSTMAIPSVEHIANLPLDYKFPRFSPDKPCTTGYFPKPPDSLLNRCKSLT